MEVNIFELGVISDSLLSFVVMPSRYLGKWAFVRHKDRFTWEMPGGHIEYGEIPLEAAKRDLYEETGAVEFGLEAVFDYSVTNENRTTYGRVFSCKIDKLGSLPQMEIEEVRLFDDIPEDLTYPYIQGLLYSTVKSI